MIFKGLYPFIKKDLSVISNFHLRECKKNFEKK